MQSGREEAAESIGDRKEFKTDTSVLVTQEAAQSLGHFDSRNGRPDGAGDIKRQMVQRGIEGQLEFSADQSHDTACSSSRKNLALNQSLLGDLRASSRRFSLAPKLSASRSS